MLIATENPTPQKKPVAALNELNLRQVNINCHVHKEPY